MMTRRKSIDEVKITDLTGIVKRFLIYMGSDVISGKDNVPLFTFSH
jgi:hypothetical protein